jgi:hypothetical protein
MEAPAGMTAMAVRLRGVGPTAPSFTWVLGPHDEPGRSVRDHQVLWEE